MVISPYGGTARYSNRQKRDYKFLNNIAKDFIKNMPVKFGSFEKATYYIQNKYDGRYFYRFTTTCHHLEDCIDILKNKYLNVRIKRIDKNFNIVQVKNGIEKIVYEGSR
jgi:hypothetical protein